MAAWDYQNPSAASQPINRSSNSPRLASLDARLLAQWIGYLGLGEPKIALRSRLPMPTELPALQDLVRLAMRIASALSSQSDRHAGPRTDVWSIPPHSAAVHPSPTGSVAVAWRSPIAGAVRIRGRIADGDPNGGDGVGWTIVRRRGHASDKLAAGLHRQRRIAGSGGPGRPATAR